VPRPRAARAGVRSGHRRRDGMAVRVTGRLARRAPPQRSGLPCQGPVRHGGWKIVASAGQCMSPKHPCGHISQHL